MAETRMSAPPQSDRPQLSQGSLNLLAVCPRKFQHTVLEQLGPPTDPEQQERLAAGQQFHQLMQQWHLGLPIDHLLSANPDFATWFQSFQQAQDTVLGTDATARRQSEQSRTLYFEGFWLTVVYDLLIEREATAQILDWKTYPRPQTSDRLEANWQTRLYPFVLVETSDYAPAQVSMTYWFFQRSPEAREPQQLRFAYDAAQHARTHQDLQQQLRQLDQWLTQYQQDGTPFPQVPEGSKTCHYCRFAARCDRHPEATPTAPAVLLHPDRIAEIPI